MTKPLIWAAKDTLFALDPAAGTLRWRVTVGQITRLFSVGERLFVLNEQGVTCLEEATGAHVGTVRLEFMPSAGLPIGDTLVVAGTKGAACLGSDGSLLWSAKHEFQKGFSMKQLFVCQSSTGQELWREEVGSISRYDNPGLLYDGSASQPDIDSQ